MIIYFSEVSATDGWCFLPLMPPVICSKVTARPFSRLLSAARYRRTLMLHISWWRWYRWRAGIYAFDDISAAFARQVRERTTCLPQVESIFALVFRSATASKYMLIGLIYYIYFDIIWYIALSFSFHILAARLMLFARRVTRRNARVKKRAFQYRQPKRYDRAKTLIMPCFRQRFYFKARIGFPALTLHTLLRALLMSIYFWLKYAFASTPQQRELFYAHSAILVFMASINFLLYLL